MKPPLLLLERLKPDLFGGLAMEDLLLDQAGAAVLFLWRGEKGLVLGKNQNPWREANLTVLREKNLVLARRVSGGGAVVHDPGNLNISWVMERSQYDAEEIHSLLRSALASLGLEAQTSPGGATLIQGRKVSGSAYCFRRERVLHHSTLLVDADLQTLRAALSVPRIRLESHAVPSLPAQVANLRDFNKQLTLVAAIDALKRAVRESGLRIVPWADGPDAQVESRRTHLRDPSWVWGQTPRFRAEIPFENSLLHLSVAKGVLEELRFREKPVPAAVGLPFDIEFPARLAAVLGRNPAALRSAFAAQGWNGLDLCGISEEPAT